MNELQQTMMLVVSRLVHDLKNPLAVVLSNMRFLEVVIDEGDQHEALRESVVSADRLDRMLDDSMDLVRLMAGGVLRSARKEVVLAEMGAEIAEKLELLVGNRTLEVVLPETRVKTEASLLSRILINILEHALRQTPSRGVVRLEADTSDGETILRVVDGGAPFDPDATPSFLEDKLPVKQAPPEGCRSDQGLRLFFAGKAARSFGARTELNRRKGEKGVVFVLRLPNEVA
jgi:K+-sensing histidine kinase KdpD